MSMFQSPAAALTSVGDLLVAIRATDGQAAVVRTPPGDQDSLLEFLYHLPLLRTPVDDAPEEASLLDEGSASFMVAQVCNLRCKYCFAGDGDYGVRGMMTWGQARGILETLFARRRPGAAVHINFFGGEPLLAWPLIERVVEYANARGEREGANVQYTMTTNATRVSKERAAFLAKHGFTIIVSIDGTQEDHDAARPDTAGRGTWNTVVAGARLLLEALGPDNVIARATLRAGHSSYEMMEQALTEIGFQDINLLLEDVHPAKVLTHGIPARDWERKKAHIDSIASSYEVADIVGRGRPQGSDQIKDAIQLIINGQSLPRPCGVGGMSVAVSPDGTVFPCHRFVGDYRYGLGEVNGDGQVETNPKGRRKFADAYRIVQESCRGCYARRFCAGNCLHVAVQRLDHGLPPHDEHECDAIRAGVIGALRAVVRHVDPGAAAIPRVLDRRILNKACKVAFFSAQRAIGSGNEMHH